MAKKVISGQQKGSGKSMVKIIRAVKSSKTGAYTFKENIVPAEQVNAFLEKK